MVFEGEDLKRKTSNMVILLSEAVIFFILSMEQLLNMVGG